jgi:cell division inhibitor SepF
MNRPVSTEVSVVRRNARAWLGLAEHDNDVQVNRGGYASEDVSEVQDDDENPSGQLAMDNGIEIAVVRPRNFRDAATIGEYYRQEIPVIINLEDLDHALATRIIDFVSGLVLGLRGDMERLSRRAFLIVPADTAILTTHEGLTEEGFFNQALRLVIGALCAGGTCPLPGTAGAVVRGQVPALRGAPAVRRSRTWRS